MTKSNDRDFYLLRGEQVGSTDIRWTYTIPDSSIDNPVGFRLEFFLKGRLDIPYQPLQAIAALQSLLQKSADDFDWLVPDGEFWQIDLDYLTKTHARNDGPQWFTGTVYEKPEVTPVSYPYGQGMAHTAIIGFNVTPKSPRSKPVNVPVQDIPVEIQESLVRFRSDYPDPTKVAFVMMKFGKTKAHKAIFKVIETCLKKQGITALRADSKEYHEDLFSNIITYTHGAGFGVAVFDRIQSEEFNPNVALEVGYMLALRKQVCLLKDMTVKSLHADVIGKLYKEFDPQDPAASIPDSLNKWLDDKLDEIAKRIIRKPDGTSLAQLSLPDIRLNVTKGRLINPASRDEIDVVKVDIQNHSNSDFFLKTLVLEFEGENGGGLSAFNDPITGRINNGATVKPGASYQFHWLRSNFGVKNFAEYRGKIHRIAVFDEIDRKFYADPVATKQAFEWLLREEK
jgi:hypothetical protein